MRFHHVLAPQYLQNCSFPCHTPHSIQHASQKHTTSTSTRAFSALDRPLQRKLTMFLYNSLKIKMARVWSSETKASQMFCLVSLPSQGVCLLTLFAHRFLSKQTENYRSSAKTSQNRKWVFADAPFSFSNKHNSDDNKRLTLLYSASLYYRQRNNTT